MTEFDAGRGRFREVLDQLGELEADSSSFFRAVLNSMEDLVFILDDDGVFHHFIQEESKRDLFATPENFIGRHFRDVLPPEATKRIQQGLDDVRASGIPGRVEYSLEMGPEIAWFDASISQLRTSAGDPVGFVALVRNISESKRTEIALGEAMSRVKLLSGLLPICAACKKIRDDSGYWKQIEEYISDHSEAEFTHGICPECFERAYRDAASDE